MAAAGFRLCVFNEFAAPEAACAALADIVAVDRAPEPAKLAKTDAERLMVMSNAKLFFPLETDDAAVDAVLAKLGPLGLKVTHRHPVTSTGYKMLGRVILALDGVALPAA